MTEVDPPICPCCGKPVPPDKIEAFRRNLTRFTADSPDPDDLAFQRLIRRLAAQQDPKP